VALGKVFEEVMVSHNMSLPFDMVKVMVENVCDSNVTTLVSIPR